MRRETKKAARPGGAGRAQLGGVVLFAVGRSAAEPLVADPTEFEVRDLPDRAPSGAIAAGRSG